MRPNQLPKPGLKPSTLMATAVLLSALGFMLYWIANFFPYGV